MSGLTKPQIAIVNASTCVKDADVAAIMTALQKQVSSDFAPIWGVDADLSFFEDKRLPIPPAAMQLIILDNSDQAGALGYHDVTANNQPMGKCFAGTDLEYGEVWQRTLSHELLELLADPMCVNFAMATFQGKSIYTLKEVCDAVESDAVGYLIDGVPLSDFVTPAFFDTMTAHPPGTKFDFCGAIQAPMTIAPGGYLSIMDPMAGTGWGLVYGQHVPLHKRLPPKGSRRERFLLRVNHGRDWQMSLPR